MAKKIAQRYSLGMILLFGSRVSGRINQNSDFDIAFLPKKKLTGEEEVELNCKLMNVFGSDKIDTTNIKNASPFLTFEIARNPQLIFGEEKDFLKFKIAAFKKYIDHLPLFNLRNALIEKRQAALKASIYGK